MAEYKFNKQQNYGWGLTFNMTGKAPIVNKRIFAKLEDAQNFVNDVNDSAIQGLILSVIDDGDNNGAYFVKSIGDGSTDGILEKIGADSSTDITSLRSDITSLRSDVTELKAIDHSAFIKGVKVNGEKLEPQDQIVDITIDTPTYETEISETTKESTNAPQTKAVYDYVTNFVNGVKTDLENKLSAVETFKFQVVDSLDSLSEISLKTIYLVKKTEDKQENQNIYTEYIRVNDEWEILGELKFDPTELETSVGALEGKVNTLETALNGDGTDDNPGLVKRIETVEDKIQGIITTGGEPNKIEKITLDSVELEITNKTVNIPLSEKISELMSALSDDDIDKALTPTNVQA